MAQDLSDMTIEEISLVDDPANEQARVLIVKAKKGKAYKSEGEEDEEEEQEEASEMEIAAAMRLKKALEEIAPDVVQAVVGGEPINPEAAGEAAASLKEYTMDIEVLSKALEDAEARLDTLEKRATDAEAALADANEIIKAKDAELEAVTKANGGEEEGPSEEEVIKSLPESIRKRLEEADQAQEELAKAKAKAEEDEAVAMAKSLNVGKAEELGPVLLRVRKGMTTEADADTIERLLKSLGEVSVKSLLFKSMGSDAAVDGEPEALLKAKADEIKKANQSLTDAQAYAKATEENPHLYNAYIAKRRAA
jgi:hypothetical protein